MDEDVFVYTGEISRYGYSTVTDIIEKRKKDKKLQKNVVFCLATYGGDPNAGYRIGRALQHNYDKITVFIFDLCKSAGTLLAISADKLLIGDRGELGPLDIQLQKNDEIGELSSGLAIMTALNALNEHAVSSFASNLVKIRYGNRISTKMSAEISTKLTEAMISPMSSQIDPIKLGEHQRAMSIAISYGNRLAKKSKNLKDGALSKLIASYPSHGFVIDRKEARDLFHNVESPVDEKLSLYNLLCEMTRNETLSLDGKPTIMDITVDEKGGESANVKESEESGDGNPKSTSGSSNSKQPRTRKRNRRTDTTEPENAGTVSIQAPAVNP